MYSFIHTNTPARQEARTSPRRTFGSMAWAARLGLMAAALTLLPLSSHAQQWVVDDAAITEPGACQVEAWWGEAERWFLPACTLLPRTEITLGAGWFDRGLDRLDGHLFAEAKLLARDSDALPWGWGIVVGTALAFEGSPDRTSEVFAYVPVSVNLERIPLVLHANAGWAREWEAHGDHSHTHDGVLWGLRGDLGLTERFALLGEVFGLSGEGAEAQAGIRFALLPELLTLDVSYGFALDSEDDGLGLQIGLAWTPAPFRPLRP